MPEREGGRNTLWGKTRCFFLLAQRSASVAFSVLHRCRWMRQRHLGEWRASLPPDVSPGAPEMRTVEVRCEHGRGSQAQPSMSVLSAFYLDIRCRQGVHRKPSFTKPTKGANA